MIEYYITVRDRNGKELNVYKRDGKENVLALLNYLMDNATWRFEIREV